MFANWIKSFFDNESGQGITEYGAMLAFVGLMIAMVFSGGHGILSLAIQSSFSSITHSLNSLTSGS